MKLFGFLLVLIVALTASAEAQVIAGKSLAGNSVVSIRSGLTDRAGNPVTLDDGKYLLQNQSSARPLGCAQRFPPGHKS